MDSSVPLLCGVAAALLLRDAHSEAAGAAGGRGGAVGEGRHVVHSCPFQLRVSVSSAEVSAEPAEEQRDGLGELGGARGSSAYQLADCLPAAAGRGGYGSDAGFFVVGHRLRVVFVHRLRRLPADVDGLLRRGVFRAVGLS